MDFGSGSPVNPCQTSNSFSELMILSFATRGQRVLDLFAGVGTNAVTCARLGINVTSVEHDARQARIICSRLTDLANIDRQAFLNPVKIPAADLFPVAAAPTTTTTLPENPLAYTVLPYKSSGLNFSALSLTRYEDLLVRLVSASFPLHSPPPLSCMVCWETYQTLMKCFRALLQHESVVFYELTRQRAYNQDAVQQRRNELNASKTSKMMTVVGASQASIVVGDGSGTSSVLALTNANIDRMVGGSPAVLRQMGRVDLQKVGNEKLDVMRFEKITVWPSREWRMSNAGKIRFGYLHTHNIGYSFPPDNFIDRSSFAFGLAGIPWSFLKEDSETPLSLCLKIGSVMPKADNPFHWVDVVAPFVVLSGFKADYTPKLKEQVERLFTSEGQKQSLLRDPTTECLCLRVVNKCQLAPDFLNQYAQVVHDPAAVEKLFLSRFSFLEDPLGAEQMQQSKPHIGNLSHLVVVPLGLTSSPFSYGGPLPDQLPFDKMVVTTHAHHPQFATNRKGVFLGVRHSVSDWYDATVIDVNVDKSLLKRFSNLTTWYNTDADDNISIDMMERKFDIAALEQQRLAQDKMDSAMQKLTFQPPPIGPATHTQQGGDGFGGVGVGGVLAGSELQRLFDLAETNANQEIMQYRSKRVVDEKEEKEIRKAWKDMAARDYIQQQLGQQGVSMPELQTLVESSESEKDTQPPLKKQKPTDEQNVSQTLAQGDTFQPTQPAGRLSVSATTDHALFSHNPDGGSGMVATIGEDARHDPVSNRHFHMQTRSRSGSISGRPRSEGGASPSSRAPRGKAGRYPRFLPKRLRHCLALLCLRRRWLRKAIHFEQCLSVIRDEAHFEPLDVPHLSNRRRPIAARACD